MTWTNSRLCNLASGLIKLFMSIINYLSISKIHIMKHHLIVIFLIAFTSNLLHAQDPIYILPNEQRGLIDNGYKCLKEKQKDCN